MDSVNFVEQSLYLNGLIQRIKAVESLDCILEGFFGRISSLTQYLNTVWLYDKSNILAEQKNSTITQQ